jgi:hypothetical protein
MKAVPWLITANAWVRLHDTVWWIFGVENGI